MSHSPSCVDRLLLAEPGLMQAAWTTRFSHGRNRQHATLSGPSAQTRCASVIVKL